ncbi:Crp/Fnr family transcriptional regulator [Stakelama marina]|uniref:Helix-turn-helix domain-containing protein n=1 Tax=Stakelama marina TaxID=2826939 RepID=A0A8T4IBR7_9SPHN|nr:helix-turn-helix domain-containing protein [Stakelama marina]MBR0551274.1 helix-turn-helix domain-containing protein [Stakelama marina]
MKRLGRTERLRAGQTFRWEDDEVAVVGTLRVGALKIGASLSDGREQILGLVLPGDFVGRLSATGAAHRVTAAVDSTLCVFRRSRFADFVHCNPELEHALLDRAFAELARARDRMLLLGRKTAGERVASLLLELAERSGIPHGGRIALPLTRGEMADLLGLTIETVSRKITALQRAGTVALPDPRGAIVRDREALRIAAFA